MEISLVNALANLSAVGILGYWIIYGLPKMNKDIQDNHREQMKEILDIHLEDRRVHTAALDALTRTVGLIGEKLSSVCHHDKQIRSY